MAVWSLLKPSEMQIGILTFYLLNIVGVMESVLSLYPTQSWDTSILPVLSSYGEPFMDVVCRDSCDGHDVGRVSMLSSINLRKTSFPYFRSFHYCFDFTLLICLYANKKKRKKILTRIYIARVIFYDCQSSGITYHWTVSVRPSKLKAKACNT